MDNKEFLINFKKSLDKNVKDFGFKQKQIKKTIEQAKKNGEEIVNICDDIIDSINDDEEFDFTNLASAIIRIKNIAGGVNNER